MATMWHAFLVSGTFYPADVMRGPYHLQGIVALPGFPQDQKGYDALMSEIEGLSGEPGDLEIQCFTPLGMVPEPAEENQGEPVG